MERNNNSSYNFEKSMAVNENAWEIRGFFNLGKGHVNIE